MFLGDSLTNLVSGLGTDRDKATFGRFAPNLVTKADLDALYSSNWLAQTIIDAPAEDMTRRWRRWNAGPRQIQKIEATERRLGLRGRITRAAKQARLYGGSAVLLGDGASDLSQPLEPDRIGAGGLKYVTVLSRHEMVAGPLVRDHLDPLHGEPEWYEIWTTSSVKRVHPSRMVRFLSVGPLEIETATDGWGGSILQACFDPIRNATAASAAAAAMMQEAKFDVIKVPGLTQNAMDPAFRGRVLARFGLANLGKGIVNAILLDKEEEWDQKQLSLANVPDVIRSALEEVAGAADIPLTRFLGTSAKGLNNGGQVDTRNYYDSLSSAQVNDLGPPLDRIDDVLIRSALGSRPADIYYQWNSLWQMDEAAAADIAAKKAQAVKVYAEAGVMPPSALRRGVQNQLMEDGLFPGLEDALAAARDAGEVDAPLVASARATAGAAEPN